MNVPGGENQRVVPTLCEKGCGFYGNPTTRNLCSKCYRTVLLDEQNEEKLKCQTAAAINSVAKLESNIDGVAIEGAPQSRLDTILVGDGRSQARSQSSLQDNNDLASQLAPRVVNAVNEEHVEGSLNSISYSGKSIQECCDVRNSMETDNSSASAEIAAAPMVQANIGRCFKCNKKIGLLGFQCRCNYFFCGTHRYADSHDCSFDYKSFGRQQLSKANQKVVADKLNRI